MKSRLIFLLFWCAIPAATAAQTADFDRFQVSVGVGPAYAIARLGDLADIGGQASLSLEIHPFSSNQALSLVAGGTYLRLKAREQGNPDVSVMTGTLDLKLSPSWQSDTRAYLLAGSGMGQVKLLKPGPGDYLSGTSTTKSHPLVELGIGMERETGSGPGYFVELKGVNIISDRYGDYRYGQLTFGLRF